jgi:hypothetical protein
MVSASWVPLCFAGYDALDRQRGVPAPGLTGSPSTLIVLATWKSLLAVLSGGRGRRCAGGAAAGHDRPGDPRRAIGRCHGHDTHWLALEQRRQPWATEVGVAFARRIREVMPTTSRRRR